MVLFQRSNPIRDGSRPTAVRNLEGQHGAFARAEEETPGADQQRAGVAPEEGHRDDVARVQGDDEQVADRRRR